MNFYYRQLRMNWEEKVESLALYADGDEEISINEFATLFKKTFELIRYAKNEFIYKNVYPEDMRDTFEYLHILSVLSKYKLSDIEDLSDDKIFTATCLIAQKLVDFATLYSCFETLEDGRIKCFDSVGIDDGILTFYISNESKGDARYTYNVYEGNFDEMLELAQLTDN